MNIEVLSRYAEGTYFALLLGHALEPDFIEEDIRRRYGKCFVKSLVTPFDYSIVVETDQKIILVFAGTKNFLGWIENLAAFPTPNGFHYGYDFFFRKYKEDPIAEIVGMKPSKSVVCYGYSQGGAVQGRANLFCREILLCADVEGYSFCGPTWVNSKGVTRLKAARMRQTTVRGDRDIVDDVGELIGGTQYGYQVKLPPVGSNAINGHYYSNFCVAMQKLMAAWGKPREMEFIASLAGLATI